MWSIYQKQLNLWCLVAILMVVLVSIPLVSIKYEVIKPMPFLYSGSKPHAESHAGLIYCCVGFLSLTQQLHRIDSEKLCWWLCERQLPSGGLNGRPEKLPDVCYSWWVLSSLTIMGRLHWIKADQLEQFILSCQDNETGGFSDRTGNLPDIFHTLFGLAALSLLKADNRLKPINATLW